MRNLPILRFLACSLGLGLGLILIGPSWAQSEGIEVRLEKVRLTLGSPNAGAGAGAGAGAEVGTGAMATALSLTLTLELEVPSDWEIRPADKGTMVISDPQGQTKLVLGTLPPPRGMEAQPKESWSGIMAQALEKVILPAFEQAGYQKNEGAVPIDQEGSGAWVTLKGKPAQAQTPPTLQIYALLEKGAGPGPGPGPNPVRGIFAVAEMGPLSTKTNSAILGKIISSLRFLP
jgi:hypothetical protein